MAIFFEREKPNYVIDAAARVGGILANNNYPYQFLMDNSNIKDKKTCKELVYVTLFGRNGKSINNPFAKLFPKIYNFLIDYKKNKIHIENNL